MVFGMGRGRWHAVAVLGLLVVTGAVAGAVAWQTWRSTSAGPFDPVAAVIALAGLAVSIATWRLAVRMQQQADTDVVVARRLAVAVWDAETEARRQLLGGHDRTIDVQFSFRPAPAHNAEGASKTGSLDEIVDYYRKLKPQRMVITGAPGSGKTVLAVQLILGLLKARAEDEPVPVRMSAALLDTSRPPNSAVKDWLVGHLRQVYQLPKAAARQVVKAGMVLPVLDGLDEMDATEEPGYASRAGQAIRACNAYLDGGDKAAMVLTCRIGQYQALEQEREWVHDAARLELGPVGLRTARRFLAQRVTEEDRWQPVLKAMRRPGSRQLAKALSTPWRLTLAATVYEQRDPATNAYLRDPDELTCPHLDAEDKIRDHLLGLFIPAAVAVQGDRYSPPNVHQWLGVLACYLDANTPTATRPARVIAGRTLSGTDLVLHEMWPLAGFRSPRAFTSFAAGLMAAIALSIAVFSVTHGGTIFGPLQFAIIPMIIVGIVLVRYAWTAWPSPRLGILRQLRTSRGRRLLVLALGAGALAGLVAGFVTALGFALWVGFGVVLAVVSAGLTPEFREYSVTKPGELVRTDLVVALVVALVAGIGAGIVIGLRGPVLGVWLAGHGLVAGFVAGLATGLLFGLVAGLAGCRYIALLLWTRRWSSHPLRWPLGSFLHWCYDAGLIRAAGIGYQFRHRELQDYLARNPALKHGAPSADGCKKICAGKSE
jgi:hypothetical protein